MKTQHRKVFVLSSLATALLAAFGGVQAQEDNLKPLIAPQSEVSLGIGVVDRDNAIAGQYNGLHDAGVYPNASLSVVQRDDSTGNWLRVQGRNLGLDNRELRFDHEAQGNWRYGVEYSETLRHEPLHVKSRLTGFGTSTPNADNPLTAPLHDLEFETKRKAIALAFDKDLGSGLGLQLRFRNEDKDGDRIFGSYFPNKRFLAEPIDYKTLQWDATLNFAQERWQLSGGYSGSAFQNGISSLVRQGGGANGAIALPPDNQAHEVFVAGGYQFASTTRGTFKVSYGRATQSDRFIVDPTLNSRTDLGGEVDTTRVQLGLTSHPLPKLNLNAMVRYEDRDDKTPSVQYMPATQFRSGFNVTHSPKTLNGKVEAGYQLPMAFLLVGGVEYEQRKRSVPTVTSVRYRRETEELVGRLELRRALTETLGGSLSYMYADRKGSDFVPTNARSSFIEPIHWGDREREKWRLALDWTPLDAMSVQFVTEDARDKYPGGPLGREKGTQRLYSVDANYVISEAWQASAWFTQDDLQTKQRQQQRSTLEIWTANLRTHGDAVGVGVQGKLTGKLQMGAELEHSRDRAEQRLQASTGSLPDILYKRTAARLNSTYAVLPNAGVRLDASYERWVVDDWTWKTPAGFFTDGTVVSQDPVQKVTFVGVSGYYRWW